MEITIAYLEEKYKQLNGRMFDNELPPVQMETGSAKTYLAKCCYKERINRKTRKGEYFDFRIRVNIRFVWETEAQLEDVLIHEMIHLYILYNRLPDNGPHGQIFVRMMNDINERYGRHICVRHKASSEESAQMRNTRRAWHVIAVVTFTDGKVGIKVLPRIVERITNYYHCVMSASEVSDIRLYMSDDIFWNRYPNSSALKVYYLDSTEIEQHLHGAEKLKCVCNEVLRNQ